jgi:integrase
MTALELAGPAAAGSDLDRLQALLTGPFLAAVGWDPDRVVLTLEPGPFFRNHRCPSQGCGRVAAGSDGQVCLTCQSQARRRGVPAEEIIRTGPGVTRMLPTARCDVAGCGRIRRTRLLCLVHEERRSRTGLDQAAYIATGPVPAESFGECAVPACLRGAAARQGLCIAHQQHLRPAREASPGLDVAAWTAAQPAADWDVIVSLRGLPELVRAQLLVGMQQRLSIGGGVEVVPLRSVIRFLQHGQYQDLSGVPAPAAHVYMHRLLRGLQDGLRVSTATVGTEVLQDVWDLRVFGMKGILDFTGISQIWMREALKHWAAETISTLRDPSAVLIHAAVSACQRLGTSLKTRPDGGHDLAVLGRRDVLAYLSLMGYLERTGVISARQRTLHIRCIRRVLCDCRDRGLAAPGRPLHRLGDGFAVFRDDVPRPPLDDGKALDLPPAVMKTLTQGLGLFAARSGDGMRRLTEILMDTGRRPDEICQLPVDCLTAGQDGKWVLIWTNFKGNRRNRRLPINNDTAEVIQAQQAAVTARYPATPRGKLALFPRPRNNLDGVFPLDDTRYAHDHRAWIRMFPAVFTVTETTAGDATITRKVAFTDGTGQEFDPALIKPYAYRHTYCQRHADQGTGPDLLKDLMDHRSMATTQGYYRVREKRLRTAVDRVYARQVTGHGAAVWPAAIAAVDDATRARIRIGEIAVPYGTCTEPSNVKAAGTACPYKFTCIACSHFRSDPSYLPELRAYHDRLLETRQRIRAAADLDEWAKDKADPADEEITAIGQLITKLETDARRLSGEDRSLLERAVQLVRSARRSVDLGMPGQRPATDPRAVQIR